PSVLEEVIRERFDRAFAFRRAFAQLDPADFGVYYIQLFFLVADANAFDWATPIEGTYGIVYGERPSGWDRAGRPDAIGGAKQTLAAIDGVLEARLRAMADHREGRFAPWVR